MQHQGWVRKNICIHFCPHFSYFNYASWIWYKIQQPAYSSNYCKTVKKKKSLDILELPSSSFCVSTSSGPGTSMTRGSGQCHVLACCNCLSWSSADSKCMSCSSGSTVAMVGSSVMRAAVPWSSQRSSILARPSSVRGPRDDWLTEIT